MNSRSEGFSANKYYFVSIAHKKTAIFALSTLSTMFGRLRSAYKTPCNHYTSPYTPSVAGDAAAAIDLAINRAKMGLAGHSMHRSNLCHRNPSSIKRGQMEASCLNEHIELTINWSKKRGASGAGITTTRKEKEGLVERWS
jgi:hypothetical protein